MNLLSVCLLGALAGGLLGLLGSGGGVMLLLILRPRFPHQPHRAFALCVSATAVLAALTLWRYQSAGDIGLLSSAPFLFPAMAGGVIGAQLLGKVPPAHLNLIFALICLIGGVRMVFF